MNDIFDALSEDYEALIRNARRCAYDLKHAADSIPEKDFLADRMQTRASMWITLFAKGNPGKDYRHQLQYRIYELENAFESLEKYYQERDTPPEIKAILNKVITPF